MCCGSAKLVGGVEVMLPNLVRDAGSRARLAETRRHRHLMHDGLRIIIIIASLVAVSPTVLVDSDSTNSGTSDFAAVGTTAEATSKEGDRRYQQYRNASADQGGKGDVDRRRAERMHKIAVVTVII